MSTSPPIPLAFSASMASAPYPYFFDLKSDDGFPIELLATRDGTAVARVEAVMESIIAPDSSLSGLRLVVISKPWAGRAVFLGSEKDATGATLASRISAVDQRIIHPSDAVFPVLAGAMTMECPEHEVIRLALHFIASLIAMQTHVSTRRTTYVCVCIALLSAVGPQMYARLLVDDILRMWLRAELKQHDRPEWDYAAVERLRQINPLAGAFMAGLGDALKGLPVLRFPTTFEDVLDAAEFLIASATLSQTVVVGSA